MVIKLRQLLPETMENPNLPSLEKEAKIFAQKLITSRIITARQQPLTVTTEQPIDYIEGLAEVIRNAVLHWMDVENHRGGR